MRRISTLLTIAAGLFFFCGSAHAATVTMKGTVDWSALTHFNTAHSAEIFFADVSQDVPPVTVVSLTKIVNKTAKYSVTLNANTPYFVGAVIADCASNPEQCGTAAVTGTHIRFNNFVTTTPGSGSITVNVTADPTNYPLDPLAICGSLSVQSGTFVKAVVGAESAMTCQVSATGSAWRPCARRSRSLSACSAAVSTVAIVNSDSPGAL